MEWRSLRPGDAERAEGPVLFGGGFDTSIGVHIGLVRSLLIGGRRGEASGLRYGFAFELKELPGVHGIFHHVPVVEKGVDLPRNALV